MCGIAGILNFNNKKVEICYLKNMTDTLVHRGPDGEGHWVNEKENIGFGHRRLSIIDLTEGGHQPMHYGEGRYAITFNGEIYNYVELKSFLKTKGFKFKSNSDTEVVLASYHYWGENCLSHFDGMFAMAIWDEKQKEMFCARDRFGEKPFYYFKDKESIIFASEIKAIRAVNRKIEMSQKWVREFAIQGTLRGDLEPGRTTYDGVLELEAGNWMKISSNGTLHKKRYWTLKDIEVNNDISFDRAKAEYLGLFEQSVIRRMRSDVAVGSSLSGGLDSSSIVMLINGFLGKGQKQKTFSARFNNFEKDEGKYIDSVIAKCKNVEGVSVWPENDDIIELCKKVAFYQEEPFGSSSILLQWKVMELAKKHNVTVLLDGQGADEFLGGYLPIHKTYLYQLFFENRKLYKNELKAYQGMHNENYYIEDYQKTETKRMKIGRWKKSLLGQDIKYETLKQNLRNLTEINGLKTLLRYADRNSMANSREVRLPFLNHELVEFVFALPDSFILNGGWTKYIHRCAFDPILPKEISWRKEKVGFEPPQERWMDTNDIREIIKKQQVKYDFNQTTNLSYTNSSDWRLFLTSFYE